MSSSMTVALLAVLTTAGLVGAAVTDGPLSIGLAVATVAVAAGLAWRLRSAPPGASLAAAFVTGILIVSAGLPAAIVLTETRGRTSSTERAAAEPRTASPVADPSAELRRALAKAVELLPGGADSILSIDIDENSTQVYVLDLATGQRISANYSQSSGKWYDATRHPTTDRADAAFRAADIAGLDLTATAKKATAAADTIGIDRTHEHASDGIEIKRRYQDTKLVAVFSMSAGKVEADQAGNLPDNLALAKVDGLLPVAERLLRANGIDPAQPVIDELKYSVYAPNASSVVSSNKGTVEITVDGAGRYGTLKETVGQFPEVRLRPDSSPSRTVFALRAVDPAGIEKARTDLVARFAVLPIDAHALALEVDSDSRSSSRSAAQPIMQVGVGPSATSRAYYALDGAYLRAS